MDSSVTSLDEIQTSAISALKRYGDASKEERTTILRSTAELFISAREFIFNKDGEPDRTGITGPYRQWVREIMARAGIPNDQTSSVQAAIRYHSSNIMRERFDAEELEAMGLSPRSARDRSSDRHARESAALNVVTGSTHIATAPDVLAASRTIAAALRRVSLEAVKGMAAPERKEIRDALTAVRDLAEAVAVAAGSRRK
jgi:hypothetical protein